MTRGIVLIFLQAFLLSGNLMAQPDSTQAKKVPKLFQMLEEYHYYPPSRDRKLSNHIFDQLILSLDPYGLIFSKETLNTLGQFRDSLCSDNVLLQADFVSQLTEKYRKRLELSDSIIDRVFLAPINFSELDSIYFKTKRGDPYLAKNDRELEKRWQKWIKLGMLKSLLYSTTDSIVGSQEIIPDSLYSAGSILSRKSKIREKRRIDQLLNCSGGIPDFVWNSYLNSITSCYDPHSNYFSDNDKKQFESSLSKDNYAFGFELGNNLNDEVIISKVMPLSPLWYARKIEKGDVLLKIKIPDQEETDLAYASIGEVDEMFKSLKSGWVELTVRKPNGSIVKVEITKGNFDMKQNQTLGFILNGEKPLGYLWFSAFYTEFNKYGNVGCSIDFLKEMSKLKESGVQGLIIDLRNNPGGSEGEAMEIAAYFLGNVPFANRVNKDGVKIALKKTNAIRWYDDPVVVLVNGSSASASELLSGVLQDFHRAVIIGTNTFGKATEQLVLPLGKKMRNPYQFSDTTPDEDKGFVKITTGRIYRATGKSHQKTGVKPDIQLPDVIENFTLHESDHPYAFENDSISATEKFLPLPALPLDSLILRSKNRVANNEKFRLTTELQQSMKIFTADQTKATVNLAQYQKEAKQRKQLLAEYDSLITANNKQFTVEYSPFKIRELQSDSLIMEINGKFKSSLQKDINVGEAWSVLLDLIRIQKAGK